MKREMVNIEAAVMKGRANENKYIYLFTGYIYFPPFDACESGDEMEVITAAG